MRRIAPPRVLDLQGVAVDHIYTVASAKDREGGASRPICQRAPGVTNYRATFPHGPPGPWPPDRPLVKLPCAQLRRLAYWACKGLLWIVFVP